MGTGNHAEPGLLSGAAQTELGDQWRRLIRSATFIAVLTSPAAFIWFHEARGWSVPWAIVGAFLVVIAFRGAVDLIGRRLIPWPSLYAVEDSQLKEEDVVNRRRVWFWWYWFRVLRFFVVVITIIWLFQLARGKDATWWGTATAIPGAFDDPAIWQNLFILPLFFLINFLILFGPLMLVGVTQMRGFEPGDADWGVRLEDVRGQGIVFIDEIDAVGSRRSSLGGAGVGGTMGPPSFQDISFHGPWGALNSSQDMILETRAWRERVFAERQPPSSPTGLARLGAIVNQAVPGMFGGMGQLALNQLLVVMDGIDNPPFFRRLYTNKINTFLDACYVIPRRLGRMSFRIPAPTPRKDQIYFIGATNVPIDVLDPALTRPGRMGRHVWLRTPTKTDRLDIFDLYINKVDHEPELDTPKKRDELARITGGYSPAMIEQVCSMALTTAHANARAVFSWEDIVEAMTTVESGTA